ncbi:MAG TPA: aromatic ring-opening dioxygenase subunit LigA [Burkholderiaceae bacterium]|nr:aromatic ring-opening dioxygenase subunit LigA [Burkholderiaceae bacterium]
MSTYGLQKMIRDVNRDPQLRERYFCSPEALFQRYDMTADERRAVLERDFGALYRLGVHGLLLRPFSILHQVSESDYLKAIRQEK